MFNNVSVLLHIVFAHIFFLQASLQTKAMVKFYENCRSLPCSKTCSNNIFSYNYHIVKTLLNHFYERYTCLGHVCWHWRASFQKLVFDKIDIQWQQIIEDNIFHKTTLVVFFLSEYALSRSALLAKKLELLTLIKLSVLC